MMIAIHKHVARVCKSNNIFVTLLYTTLHSTLAVIADPANIPCSDLHIAKISEKIVSRKELTTYFGISPKEEEKIRKNNSRQHHFGKYTALWKERQRLKNKAAYCSTTGQHSSG